jgi:hypothetical protein
MTDFFKSIWLLFFSMMILGLMFSIPVEKPQKAYFKEIERIKSEPQRRIDATYRYVEAIDNGTEDLSQGLNMIPPRKYYIDNEDEEFYTQIPQRHHVNKPVENATQTRIKPRYRRDKRNPKILHPYK